MTRCPDDNEEWRDVIGYEQYFMVSPDGKVFSKRTNKVLAQTMLQTGYFVVNSRIGGRQGKAVSLRVHRMVAEAFLPPPPNDLVEKCSKEHHGKVIVRHKDDDKTNNCVGNLKWGDSQDNSTDYVKSGKSKEVAKKTSGLNSVFSKFSKEDLQRIQEMRNNGCKIRDIATMFGVAHSTISRFLRRERYRDFATQAAHFNGS